MTDNLNLEGLAFHWLLRDRRCWTVLWERHPAAHYRPDVLGITRGRLLIEIECKRTLADFHADGLKTHIANRNRGYHSQEPWKFFYLAEASLATEIQPLLPTWAGLLSATSGGVIIEREAPALRAKRLSVWQCVRVAHMLANQMASLAWNLDPDRMNWLEANGEPGHVFWDNRLRRWIDNYSSEPTALRTAVDSQVQSTRNADAGTPEVPPHANPQKPGGHESCV